MKPKWFERSPVDDLHEAIEEMIAEDPSSSLVLLKLWLKMRKKAKTIQAPIFIDDPEPNKMP